MSDYLVIEAKAGTSKLAMQRALEKVMDSNILSSEVIECKGIEYTQENIKRGFTYYKAIISFEPSESYLTTPQ